VSWIICAVTGFAAIQNTYRLLTQEQTHCEVLGLLQKTTGLHTVNEVMSLTGCLLQQGDGDAQLVTVKEGDVNMTKKSKRSNMPSKMSIINYWLNNHEKHPEAKPWMDRVGEYFIERTCPDEVDTCFACDFILGTTERAHIKALCNGGSNSPDNLHLLCPQCHKDSEFIEGQAYWNWIADRRWWHLSIKNMVARGYLTDKEASLAILNFDGDEDVRLMLASKVDKLAESLADNEDFMRLVKGIRDAYRREKGE